MPNFKYKARDKFSRPISGAVAAENKDEAVKKLQEMGYVPISIDEARELSADIILSRFRRVSLEELNSFTRQLYSMQKAGIALLSCLESVAEQTNNRYFKKVIEEVARDIRGGSTLSGAFKKYSHIFDPVYISMIRAAESGGIMSDILAHLGSLISQEIDTRQRIKSATQYPLMAFLALCAGFLVVVTFVIPRFAVIYSQFNSALPLPTRILIGTSVLLRKFWYLFLPAVGSLIFLFLRFINSKSGRPLWDRAKLKVPVFGPLVTMLVMSRFARVTAILMKSGVPILEVLELVSKSSGNIIIERAILQIRESVNQGKGISEPMRLSGLFPPAITRMVAVGEQTGRVDELLLSVADYYDTESGYMITNLTTYIEPMLIFVLAVMVLVMALAIFLPMWNLIKLFRPG